MNKRSLCIALVGPTASGKTELAIELAEKARGEIVGMDSTTVYRGFDIGSSKPSPEQRARVRHHLIDVLDPGDDFSAFQFVELAERALEDIERRDKLPIIVGGTYFYLRALQYGMYPTPSILPETLDEIEKEYFVENDTADSPDSEVSANSRMHAELKARDSKAAEKIHPNDRYRLVRALAVLRASSELPSSLKPCHRSERQASRLWLKYALVLPRDILHEKIASRTERMIRGGLLEECRKLKKSFPNARPWKSIGYAEAAAVLEGRLAESRLQGEVIEKTRQLAKRQMTWIRSDPELRFVDHRDLDRILKEIDNLKFVLEGVEGEATCVQ